MTSAMPRLGHPTMDVQGSFLEAMDEFRAEGRGGPDDESMIGWEMRTFAATWRQAEGFARYVEALRMQAREDAPRPSRWVPCTTLWYIEGDSYIGRLAIRHRLNAQLLQEGGHIGYDVRPSARRRGHATAMLRAALPVARSLGIHHALLTCDSDNVASRTVIERSGGTLEDARHGKLRYWVRCG